MDFDRWKWLVVTGMSALLVVAGCGDSTTTDQQDEQRDQGASGYLMVPSAGDELAGEVTSSVEVPVALYNRDSGEPAEGQEVEYEVVDGGDGAPSLSARNVFTDEDGVASAEVMLTNQEGSWTVVADHSSANSVEIEVTAEPAEAGDLQVELVNAAPGIMELSDVELRVYRASSMDCGFFNPLAPPDDEFVAEEFEPNTGESVTVENLSPSNTYTVTAIARGEEGQIAAGGCRESIFVEDEETTRIEMILQLIPLNPTGTYDVISNWDFTEALADGGPAGSTIVTVLDIFENPGEAIYDEIIALLANYVGGFISGSIDSFLSLTGLDDEFQDMIDDFIDSSDGLSEVRDAGREVRDVVANLEVHSELSIGKLADDQEFRGQDNWLGIVLYWSGNCEDDDDDPDCDVIDLTADDDGELAELGVLSSHWTGRVAAYDQMHIDDHVVSLRYGRLLRYILNEVMLPAVTDGNANSMSEAFAYWFGCDSLADSVTSDDGDLCALGYCVEGETIEDYCETAVNTVFGFADILIDSLEYDMGLRVGGEGRLVELTSDGMVDRIEDGIYEGYIEDSDGDATTSSFDATWEAERADDSE